jgi:hypothetical protein
MEVIIVDSITHEWNGKGGILDIHSSMTGNSFTNWSSLTPRHQKFIDAILQSKCHVITTVRRKQDYDLSKDSNGKTKVEKAGLKEETREGFEYELTANIELDIKHNATALKDRTGLFMDKPAFTPSEETGKMLLDWCETGETPIEWKLSLATKKEIHELIKSSTLNGVSSVLAKKRLEACRSDEQVNIIREGLLKIQTNE